MIHRQQHVAELAARWDVPGIVLGSASVAFGLAVHVLIPQQVSVEPIPGASQYVAFTPAAIPRLCAFAFVILGIIQLVAALRSPAQTDTDSGGRKFTGEMARDLAVLAVALILYPLLMQQVGYALATACFLLLLIVYGGERRPPVLLAVAVGMPIAIYLLFGRLMSVPLPDGLLFG